MAVEVVCFGDTRFEPETMAVLSSGWPEEWGKVLRRADVLFANLEGPICDDEVHDQRKARIASAPGSEEVLKQCRFDVVSLANNHSMDFGAKAMLSTKSQLAASGICSFGAGRNLAEAGQPAIVERDGSRLGFLGYSWDLIQSEYAGRCRPGVAPLLRSKILDDVDRIMDVVDWLVVSVHWSYEREAFPLPYQRELGQAIIRAGAHAVVGHHPHQLQGVENYRHGLIVYSLGNFIFPDIDYGTWHIRQHDYNRLGVGVRMQFSEEGIQHWELLPFVQEGKAFIPRLLSGDERQQVLTRVNELSSFFAEDYHRVYRRIRSRRDLPVCRGSRVADWLRFGLRRPIRRTIRAMYQLLRRVLPC